ncbi:MAG: hypothetical protein U0840_29925 [Gemmataceae bacterium]
MKAYLQDLRSRVLLDLDGGVSVNGAPPSTASRQLGPPAGVPVPPGLARVTRDGGHG